MRSYGMITSSIQHLFRAIWVSRCCWYMSYMHTLDNLHTPSITFPCTSFTGVPVNVCLLNLPRCSIYIVRLRESRMVMCQSDVRIATYARTRLYLPNARRKGIKLPLEHTTGSNCVCFSGHCWSCTQFVCITSCQSLARSLLVRNIDIY